MIRLLAGGPGGIDEHLHFEFGTSLRAGDFLDKGSLLDANVGYKDVFFSSQNPAGDQSKTGVIKSKVEKNKISITLQNFKSKTEEGEDIMRQIIDLANSFLNE